MNPATFSRGASSSSSTLARSFSTSCPRQLLPKERRRQIKKGVPLAKTDAPPAVLRHLVNLHHISATFLHEPKEASIGFDNAFKNASSDPYFMNYDRWKSSVMPSDGQKPDLINASTTLLGSDSDNRATSIPAPTYTKMFKKMTERKWAGGRSDFTEIQSDRDLAVREALFGTWERGGPGMSGAQPGLDGVQEWLNARGVTASQFAKEWEHRHDPDPYYEDVPQVEAPVLRIPAPESTEGEAGEKLGGLGKSERKP